MVSKLLGPIFPILTVEKSCPDFGLIGPDFSSAGIQNGPRLVHCRYFLYWIWVRPSFVSPTDSPTAHAGLYIKYWLYSPQGTTGRQENGWSEVMHSHVQCVRQQSSTCQPEKRWWPNSLGMEGGQPSVRGGVCGVSCSQPLLHVLRYACPPPPCAGLFFLSFFVSFCSPPWGRQLASPSFSPLLWEVGLLLPLPHEIPPPDVFGPTFSHPLQNYFDVASEFLTLFVKKCCCLPILSYSSVVLRESDVSLAKSICLCSFLFSEIFLSLFQNASSPDGSGISPFRDGMGFSILQ